LFDSGYGSPSGFDESDAEQDDPGSSAAAALTPGTAAATTTLCIDPGTAATTTTSGMDVVLTSGATSTLGAVPASDSDTDAALSTSGAAVAASTLDAAALERGDWPRWFIDSFDYLEGVSKAETWVTLLTSFVRLERLFGFTGAVSTSISVYVYLKLTNILIEKD
jgi:hypothetical protein